MQTKLQRNSRLIQNEMFTEELKFHMNKNNGKIILLSAVLPNAEQNIKSAGSSFFILFTANVNLQ